MEPKLPSPNHGPEQLPTFGPNIEFRPSSAPEKVGETGHERGEARAEAEAVAAPVQTAILPPVHVPQPIVDDASVSDDGTPIVAADDDLIEREWVDKAKAIIVNTKDDPYQRELQVSKLQADYLKKRYGKDLGASS